MWEAWEYLPSLVPGRAKIVEAKKYAVQHSTWSQEEVDDAYNGPSQSSDSNPLLPPVVASQEAKAPGAGLALQFGLQNLGKLEAFDRAWDRRYPNETEERFEWPWQSLTLEQVALGRLDFRKFIVLLSALSQTGLDPENAISWGQINAADAIPLEAIPGYIASEAAVRHKILVEFFSEVKDIKRKWLETDGPVSFECHVDGNDVCKYKLNGYFGMPMAPDCAAMTCKHGAAPGVWRRQSDTCLF